MGLTEFIGIPTFSESFRNTRKAAHRGEISSFSKANIWLIYLAHTHVTLRPSVAVSERAQSLLEKSFLLQAYDNLLNYSSDRRPVLLRDEDINVTACLLTPPV